MGMVPSFGSSTCPLRCAGVVSSSCAIRPICRDPEDAPEKSLPIDCCKVLHGARAQTARRLVDASMWQGVRSLSPCNPTTNDVTAKVLLGVDCLAPLVVVRVYADASDPLEALQAAVFRAGSQSALARVCGVSRAAVWKWIQSGKRLPAEFRFVVERETGVSKHLLRPDIYPSEPTSRTILGRRLRSRDRPAIAHWTARVTNVRAPRQRPRHAARTYPGKDAGLRVAAAHAGPG